MKTFAAVEPVAQLVGETREIFEVRQRPPERTGVLQRKGGKQAEKNHGAAISTVSSPTRAGVPEGR